MTITDPEDAVRALLTEAPPAAATTQQGRDRLLALATQAETNPASTVSAISRRRRRRALTIGLPVTAAAAAVTAIALVAASSGTGAGPAQPGTAHAGGRAPSTGATSVKAKLLAAIGAASGQLLYVHSTETVAGERSTENIWLSPWEARPGQTQRMRLESRGRPGRRNDLHDARRRWDQRRADHQGQGRGRRPPHRRRDPPRDLVRPDPDLGHNRLTGGNRGPAAPGDRVGQLKVVAHTELASQPVLELRHTFDSPPGSGPWTRTLWVSDRTYLPVRALSSFTEGTRAQGFTTDIIAVSYKFLPATPANLALLKPVIPAGFTQTAKPPSYPHG